ncbi:DUF6445 family protein [Thalassotalea aquiviva]|uniref:DUF6445 family protein n=1 Tax=Thalassotalea aquiviva TaxID=3242415 RepID=UPI00352B7638
MTNSTRNFIPPSAPPLQTTALSLPYEKPVLGENYWIVDDFFTNKEAKDIANRCYLKSKWKLGKPYTNELWPGMRAKNALRKKELAKVEAWIKEKIQQDNIWVVDDEDVIVDSNTAILVGAEEGSARPHADNRRLCRYGAVLYLHQSPSAHSGTSFYRLKNADGSLGGNIVKPPFENLVDALNTTSLPKDSWHEELAIENKFNRLILFKGNIVHSASSYYGQDKRDKRLAVTFFYMTDEN